MKKSGSIKLRCQFKITKDKIDKGNIHKINPKLGNYSRKNPQKLFNKKTSEKVDTILKGNFTHTYLKC